MYCETNVREGQGYGDLMSSRGDDRSFENNGSRSHVGCSHPIRLRLCRGGTSTKRAIPKYNAIPCSIRCLTNSKLVANAGLRRVPQDVVSRFFLCIRTTNDSSTTFFTRCQGRRGVRTPKS